MCIWCRTHRVFISTITSGIASMEVIGTAPASITGPGVIYKHIVCRGSSWTCRRIIITTCRPDITGYTMTTSIDTGGVGTADDTGTDMIGTSGSMRDAVMTKVTGCVTAMEGATMTTDDGMAEA